MKFYFFALAARGKGLSGSDRIFMELARRWSKETSIEIFVWEEGFSMCQRQGLDKTTVKFNIIRLEYWLRKIFILNYFALILKSIWLGFNIDLKNKNYEIIYSASDFWMDCLPGWILKLRFSNLTWIGSWYLTAMNPFTKIRGLNAFFYWISQKLSLVLLRRWADFIFITSKPDQFKFPSHLKNKRVLIIKGGVDLNVIRYWQKKFKKLPKIYDAVFQGRFHPQKGVLELIDIWKMVLQEKEDAKLIMIGDGPLFPAVLAKIKKLNLENDITLAGYKYDGEEKFKILYQSRIIVHPAIFDSGGMAAAEGMSFGLPAVSFDLEALKTYYPEGMLRAPTGDREKFAQFIAILLKKDKLYKKVSYEARDLIEKYWDWDLRAREVLVRIKKNI